MKKLSKLLALLLALAMMFSLAACEPKDKDDKDDDKKSVSTTGPAAPETTPETAPPTTPAVAAPSIIGSWEYKMDIAEAMSLYMEAALGTNELAPDAELGMIITLDFAENGNAEMIVDVDKDEFKTYLSALCANMLDYMYTVWEAQGVPKDQADAQIYDQYGMTTKEYIDQIMEASMEQALSQFPMTNKMCYKLDEEAGMIYTAETEAGLDEKTEALEYKLEGNKLTILDVLEKGESAENPLAAFGLELPWVFEKQ